MKAAGIALLVLASIICGGVLYHVYQNDVLLKSDIESMNKAAAAEAQRAAELNYQYELSVARRLEAEGK